jgi:hypothetical protein
MIQFQTNLLTVNPAYNDSIIKYKSTIVGMIKSEIIVNNSTFIVYPFNEIFSFNFKEIAKVEINTNGFKDSILPDLSAGNFIYSDSTLQTTLSGTIKTINSLTSDTINFTYSFSKNVEQLINYNQKLLTTNDVVVLLPSENNFDYSVNYTEGFPFDFAIRGLKIGDTFNFKVLNSGIPTPISNVITNGVKRIFLSDGLISSILPLNTFVNIVELYVNGVVKANIKINKIESKCGVYLKWFNENGGYSYWLFDSIFKENIKTKDLQEVQGNWDNLQNLTSTSESLGKLSNSSMQVSTKYNLTEKKYLLDILKSPKTEMYINNSPFTKQNEFNFIGVKVSDDGFTIDTKMTNNKLKITLELPATNTITY